MVPEEIVPSVRVVRFEYPARFVQVQSVEGVLGIGGTVGLNMLDECLPTLGLHLQVEVHIEQVIFADLGHFGTLEAVEIQSDDLIANDNSKFGVVASQSSEFRVFIGGGSHSVEPLD
jgi:hypothetical protein